ncbi:MAG: hypothetical protein HY619_01150, partial [Thaumarchaeota archaeon]|nr:hypothetical protein [Nitrososphaerota archaeon]
DILFDLDSYETLERKVERAKQIVAMGAHYINCHTGISEQMSGEAPFELVKKVYNEVSDAKIVVAGGLNEKTIPRLSQYKDRVEIVIVGGAITRSANPIEKTKQVLNTIGKL